MCVCVCGYEKTCSHPKGEEWEGEREGEGGRERERELLPGLTLTSILAGEI